MPRKLGEARSKDPGQVMTVEQVAAYLQLNRLTVYRYIREGKIPAARIGKLYRVLKSDVNQFLDAQKVGIGGHAAGRRRHGRPAVLPQATPQPQGRAPRYSAEAYIGPQWRDQMKEREERERARAARYPIEWVMRGLH